MSKAVGFVLRAGGFAAVVLLMTATGARAGTISFAEVIDDPLHGYCGGVGQCVDNGSNSPTTNPAVDFGFTISPGPATGSQFLIDFLIPSDAPQPASILLTGSLNGTATLISGPAWTSGQLDAYLGISAGPANAIGAFIPDSQDLLATGFFVYQVNFDADSTTLQSPSDPNVWPLENVGLLPEGTYIVGFLNKGTVDAPDWIATANSGAILIDTPPAPPVPEPASIVLLGTALGLSAGLIGRSRKNTVKS
jgi:hypothetical protein